MNHSNGPGRRTRAFFRNLFMLPGESTVNRTYAYQLVEMASQEVEKVGEDANSDDEVLAQLGYTQGMWMPCPRV